MTNWYKQKVALSDTAINKIVPVWPSYKQICKVTQQHPVEGYINTSIPALLYVCMRVCGYTSFMRSSPTLRQSYQLYVTSNTSRNTSHNTSHNTSQSCRRCPHLWIDAPSSQNHWIAAPSSRCWWFVAPGSRYLCWTIFVPLLGTKTKHLGPIPPCLV